MKKIKKAQVYFGTLALVIGVASSLIFTTSQKAVAERPPAECICPHVYDPVCIFETGQLFPNACEAICAGFTSDEFGECTF